MTTTQSRPTAPNAEPLHSGEQNLPPLHADAFSDFERHAATAEAAYYLALARGFAPGQELDDWLAAEKALEEERARQCT
jgi:hypothetical protein